MAYGTSSPRTRATDVTTSRVNVFELGDDSYLDTHYKPIKLGGTVTPLELSSDGLITRGHNYIEGNVRCQQVETTKIYLDDKIIGILTGRQNEPLLPINYHNEPTNQFAIPPKR